MEAVKQYFLQFLTEEMISTLTDYVQVAGGVLVTIVVRAVRRQLDSVKAKAGGK